MLLLKTLGILTLYTVLPAKMGSVELRTAAKVKDFIFLLVNGLLAGKTSKKEWYKRLPLPPIHLYFFPLFPDHGHPSSKINEEHKNYIRFLIFYMNRRNRLLCDIGNKFSKGNGCLTLSLIFSSLLYIQQLVIITVGISNEGLSSRSLSSSLFFTKSSFSDLSGMFSLPSSEMLPRTFFV